jgi:1-deoxy-D-xylulose-5-phosphate synthase
VQAQNIANDANRLLDTIDSPADLRAIPVKELPRLAGEIRREILSVVSRTGGHLASNLGAVELTIALHYVFNTPEDRIIWDVGHQSYAHKLLTGRRDRFHTLRQYRGMSGFPRCSESEFDLFNVGHAGTSISCALGVSEALRIAGKTSRTVAIIGDGSLSAGLAYEGLNMAGAMRRPLILILNDNEMSISPTTGALAGYLSRKLTGSFSTKVRRGIKNLLRSIPGIGEDVFQLARKIEEGFKILLTPAFLFEALGFGYVGPIDGHRIDDLIETLRNVQNLEGPVLIHVITKKGKGYSFAEENPTAFHGVGPFDIETGRPKNASGRGALSYTEVFSNTLVELAEKDERIIGITAAMSSGTGLEEFAAKFPNRFYDVGIAEQHGVTFAAGLAREGFRPVAAIYSTFLQRSYDQIVHDVCLQNLPVVFAVDRGGLVGEDGPTHHGVFDLSYLRHVPNIVVMAPKDENELRHMLYTALMRTGPSAVRYPRGSGLGVKLDDELTELPVGRAEVLREGDALAILAIGNPVHSALQAAEALAEEGIHAAVVNARFAKPLDEELIVELAAQTGRILTVEENAVLGGFGSAVLETVSRRGLPAVKSRCLGIPDSFIEHGSQPILRKTCGIDAEGIGRAARELLR